MATPSRDAPVGRHTRLLVVAPHPDDETLGAGVLIQRVLAAGGAVEVLLLTLGEANPWPQRALERRLWLGVGARQRWARRRDAEVRAALACLGVPRAGLHVLGWPDLGLVAGLLRPGGDAVAVMRDTLARLRPNLLVMPALADRHPDHAAAHVLLRLALRGFADPPVLWSYLVHGAMTGQPPLQLAATAEQQAAKLAALAAHASQTALSGHRLRRMAVSPECFAAVAAEPMVKILPWRPPAWLRSLLWISIVDGAGARSWQFNHAPLQGDRQVGYRLDPAACRDVAPAFVRLATRLPTPWIFDHWGWCAVAEGADVVAAAPRDATGHREYHR